MNDIDVSKKPKATNDIDTEEALTGNESKAQKRHKIEQQYIRDTRDFYMNNPPLLRSQKPFPLLDRPLEFYSHILNMAPNSSHRLNKNVNLFLSKEGGGAEVRIQLISSYWEFLNILFEQHISSISTELRFLLRYGLLIPSIVAPNILGIIKQIDITTPSSVSVYYVDEWIENISGGQISQTIQDETAVSGGSQLVAQQHKISQLEKQKTDLILECNEINRTMSEAIHSISNGIAQLDNREDNEFGFTNAFSDSETRAIRMYKDELSKITQQSNLLNSKTAYITSTAIAIDKLKKEVGLLEDKYGTVDTVKAKEGQELLSNLTVNELGVIRQMKKICVGKRGNHFPILYKDYFSGPASNLGTKEQVLKMVKDIEMIDYSVFCKEIKGQLTRAFPLIILLPCYGNHGICWEPFEKYSKNTSSAKIAIPMYSQNLFKTILEALGDYRWQFEKEKNGHLWMEEGLTGWYFQWFDTNIKKGDIKEQFIADYCLWIYWESKGVQKLDKEIRALFWRYIPFTEEVKKFLSSRATVYADLVRKDYNRELSGL